MAWIVEENALRCVNVVEWWTIDGIRSDVVNKRRRSGM
jgi:hypothetical protein